MAHKGCFTKNIKQLIINKVSVSPVSLSKSETPAIKYGYRFTLPRWYCGCLCAKATAELCNIRDITGLLLNYGVAVPVIPAKQTNMKKIILTTAIFLSAVSFQAAKAQVSFSINIGSQPEWGPVGYDHADYYYMPDIDTYYDIPAHQYVYYENNNWVHRPSLPARYNNYNVYNGYKVVVNDRNPWTRNDVYRAKYSGYRGRAGQTIIRDSRDAKYANHWAGDRREVRQDRKVVRNDRKEIRNDRKELRKDRKDAKHDNRRRN